jgi:hypothetical protein
MPPKRRNRHLGQQGEGAYDWIANRIFGAKLKDGEIHAPQYTSKGFRFGKFIGPGTDVYGGIKSKAVPVSKTDKASKLHDILYTLAQNPAEVRAADLRMVNKLDQIQKEKGDYKFNLYMGKMPIKAKMLAEDLGIIKKGTFSSQSGDKLSGANRSILEKERDILTQEGYGKKGKPSKWITHVKAYQKTHGCSYKEAMKLSRSTYNIKTK